MKSRMFWPLLLILLGVLLLLDNLGVLPGSVFGYLWPLLLIGLGANLLLSRGRAPQVVEEAAPLDGAQAARLALKHGAGELRVRAGAAPGQLFSGRFTGGVDKHVGQEAGRLSVTLAARTPDWFNWPGPMLGGHGLNWDVQVTEAVPLALSVESGASAGRLDLEALRVTDLNVQTGASSTVLVLPARAGHTRARVSSGAASVDITVPAGVAARIHGHMGVGSLAVDQRRFPRRDGAYESEGFATAENRVELEVEGGVGSVNVR